MVTLSVFVTGLFGLTLLGGGIYLVILGGSAYYFLAGGGLLITALLLYRRSAHALGVYAAFLFFTLVWALWEVGFDWWATRPTWWPARPARIVAVAARRPEIAQSRSSLSKPGRSAGPGLDDCLSAVGHRGGVVDDRRSA